MEKNEYGLPETAEIIRGAISAEGEFRTYPRGRSMLPLIRQGTDSVVLVRAYRHLRKYDIVLYQRSDGRYVLHRVIGEDERGYIMCGDNQTQKEYGVSDDNIVALTAAVFRGEKRLKADSFRMRLYSFIWCFMPLRRTAFFIRRCVYKVYRVLCKR